MTRPRYRATDRALAHLDRQMDAAAAPTDREMDAVMVRSRHRVTAKLKLAAGRTDLTDAEIHALQADDADTAAYVAHLRAIGRPHSPEYLARQKEERRPGMIAWLKAIRDKHTHQCPLPNGERPQAHQ